MKKLRILILLFFAGIYLHSHAQVAATKNIVEIAQAKGIELPPLPWHTMQVRWVFADSIPDFQRIDMDITIHEDVGEEYCLYISPFNGVFNGGQFYCGLQTHIGGSPTKNDLTKVIDADKGGIFSRWSQDQVTPIGLEYVDMYDDGFCASNGSEGEFCSVRRPFEWTKGTYTISLIKEDIVSHNSTPHSWVALTFTNKSNGEVRKIGRLLFEGEKLHMPQAIKAFVEIYSNGKDAYSNVPETTITFGRPRINNQPLPLIDIIAHQPISAKVEPNANTPNCAYVTSEKDEVSVHLTPDVRPQSRNEIYHTILLNGVTGGY